MGQSKPFHLTAVVVEDDVLQRDMIVSLLEDNDFEVLQCEDAETAFVAITAEHPSLLVTDVNLAGPMDGIELAYRARVHDAGLKVVIMSAHAPVSPLPDGVSFLLKPFYPSSLLRKAIQ